MSRELTTTGDALNASQEVPSSRTVEMLRQTRPWVRFFGILAFVWIGLMIVFGIGGALTGVARDEGELLGTWTIGRKSPEQPVERCQGVGLAHDELYARADLLEEGGHAKAPRARKAEQ